MYYKGQYLYSWDTPYSVYEDSGYVVTERPWYQDAVAGKGRSSSHRLMSYANHYILTTISQLQADGETVFAYDIKMEDIQNLVSSMEQFEQEQILIYDGAGTVVGSYGTRLSGRKLTDFAGGGGTESGRRTGGAGCSEKRIAAPKRPGQRTQTEQKTLPGQRIRPSPKKLPKQKKNGTRPLHFWSFAKGSANGSGPPVI